MLFQFWDWLRAVLNGNCQTILIMFDPRRIHDHFIWLVDRYRLFLHLRYLHTDRILIFSTIGLNFCFYGFRKDSFAFVLCSLPFGFFPLFFGALTPAILSVGLLGSVARLCRWTSFGPLASESPLGPVFKLLTKWVLVYFFLHCYQAVGILNWLGTRLCWHADW